ncbi:hypothetical protein HMP0721_0904, partial [Pseudoramibacter alactolyticus ATCC 23263]
NIEIPPSRFYISVSYLGGAYHNTSLCAYSYCAYRFPIRQQILST